MSCNDNVLLNLFETPVRLAQQFWHGYESKRYIPPFRGNLKDWDKELNKMIDNLVKVNEAEEDNDYEFMDIEYKTDDGKGSVCVAVDIPGATSQQVSVELNGFDLTIRATRTDRVEPLDYLEHIDLDTEYVYDSDQASAKVENGVVYVNIPITGFTMNAKTRKIAIAGAAESAISVGY